MGEFFGGLRKRGGGGMRGAGGPGKRGGGGSDIGQRGGGRLRAAGHRIGRALELADHGAEFEFQEFEDFLRRIVMRGLGHGRRRNGGIHCCRLRFGSSEQAKRHRFSRGSRKSAPASSHPPVKSWLTIACV